LNENLEPPVIVQVCVLKLITTKMKAPDNIEIYRQRYETFRHLDKLRWQMLQILVAIVSASAIFVRLNPHIIEWLFFLLLGLALLVLGIVLFKINNGIRTNGTVLRKVAESIGDNEIPDISNPWISVFSWIAILIVILGLVLIVISVYLTIQVS